MKTGTINNRWPLAMLDHRVEFHAGHPQWEVERLESMAANIGPGDVVYDIGAEQGDLTALFGTWVGETGGVVAVEPSAWYWPNIRATFEANDLATPLATFAGFADATSSNDRHLNIGGWPSAARLAPTTKEGFSNVDERPDIGRTTIDELAALTGRPPTAITIDVEGAELRVLQGAQHSLFYKPLVWVSVHPSFMRDTYQTGSCDLLRFMFSFNYAGQCLAIDHEHHWIFWHRTKPLPEGI